MKELIFASFNQVRELLKDRMDAIMAPHETKLCKQMDAIDKYISTCQKAENAEQEAILFRLKVLKELGFSKEEKRNCILPMIEAKSKVKSLPQEDFDLLVKALNNPKPNKNGCSNA